MLFTNINKEIVEYQNTPGAVLLDVREPDEYLSGHIPGAINIPLGEIEGTDIPKDTPLYIYCLMGSRSARAAQILAELGYSNVRSIGGIVRYKGEKETGQPED